MEINIIAKNKQQHEQVMRIAEFIKKVVAKRRWGYKIEKYLNIALKDTKAFKLLARVKSH